MEKVDKLEKVSEKVFPSHKALEALSNAIHGGPDTVEEWGSIDDWAGQVKNGKRSPGTMTLVCAQIKNHKEYYAKCSSLTRWILEEVVMGKKSRTGLANDRWARDLWEYLYWDGPNNGYDEGEGNEKMFIEFFTTKPRLTNDPTLTD